MFNIHNRTRQCFCMNYIDHTCIHIFFFKILQSSSNKNNQHVLYFLNAGGSLISNMTLPCVMKVKKVMSISLHICISLYFSAFSTFLYISIHFSTFLCIFHAKFAMAVWNFSENSSVLEVWGFSYQNDFLHLTK